ncbi:hypothetical protein JTE90_007906 [Oedothorax gibbosus]|uniref:Uncharacterized protein n=1 Tax=Oedothorax gibbosus TaxID=931172 RepID=A0AAV6VI03_9ARAC|nr:hypothetical protein JTE90_007906 [Oedothorax gibbosus]
MLLLRYQQKRSADAEEGGCGVSRHSSAAGEIRRKMAGGELHSEGRRAATRSTLVCIFVCGTALLSLGIGVLCTGLYLPVHDPAPWLVAGPTCIVLGVLVLLLSVEIILKLRKISAAAEPQQSPPPPKKGVAMAPPPPVVVHPATPQILDPAALEVVQHR